MEVTPVGPRALLVEVADPASALALATWARAVALPAEEVVPAARTVLLDGLADPDDTRRRLREWRPTSNPPEGPLVEVPVTYDGADLADVAHAWGVDSDEVVARHTGTAFRATFCGFAPGFAYLAGLPEELAVPRLATPRTSVPAGSVALAGAWCGIYPTASPGGWRLLGRTDLRLWDPDAEPPALLAPGARVRFVAR